MARKDDVAAAELQPRQGVADRARGQRPVRARCHRDLVLTRLVDEDQRHAGRDARLPRDLLDIDPLSHQRFTRLVAERVVPHRADEHHLRPQPRRRHRLVPALTAVKAPERPAEDRLAGRGQPGAGDHEVDIQRAHDDDPTAPGRHRDRRPSAASRRCRQRLGCSIPGSVCTSRRSGTRTELRGVQARSRCEGRTAEGRERTNHPSSDRPRWISGCSANELRAASGASRTGGSPAARRAGGRTTDTRRCHRRRGS